MEKKIYFLLKFHQQISGIIFAGLCLFCVANVLIAVRYSQHVLYVMLAVSACMVLAGIVAASSIVETILMHTIRRYLADPTTDVQRAKMLHADFCQVSGLRHLVPALNRAVMEKFVAGYRSTQFCIQSRITAKVRDLTEEMTVATATA